MIKLLEFREVTLALPCSSKEPKEVRVLDRTSLRLLKGERLALVGESEQKLSFVKGAILGTLPAKARTEGGELCYRGEDLFQVSDGERERLRAEMGKINGNPALSFQEKLPVGLQLTEAIARWQQGRFLRARDRFEMVSRVLEEEMLRFAKVQEREESLRVSERIALLKRVCQEGARMDAEYSLARDRLTILVHWCESLLEELSQGRTNRERELILKIRSLKEIKNDWLFPRDVEEIFLKRLERVRSLGETPVKGGKEELCRALEELLQTSQLAFDGRGADFYGIAWLKEQGEEVIPWQEPLEDLFDSASRHFGDAFLNDLCIDLAGVSEAIQERCVKERRKAAQVLEGCLPVFEKLGGEGGTPAPGKDSLQAERSLKKQLLGKALEKARAAMEACIDPLEMGRETREKTFGDYLERIMDEYLDREKENEERRRRFEKRIALRQRFSFLSHFGRRPKMEEQKETSVLRQRMVSLMKGLADDCRRGDLDSQQWDIERAQEILDDLLESSREAISRSCFEQHYCRALELLQEVGLEAPSSVMKKYPWELSLRELERAELALALVQNPRLLIWCPDGAPKEAPGEREEYLKRLLRIKKARRLSILILTQNRETALALAERIVEI